MIITLLFGLGVFASLWPYLGIMGALNFKKSENAMEEHLPGRPARRTIGRKNEDIMKAIFGILMFHVILCGALYGMPELRQFMNDGVMIGFVLLLCGWAVYNVTSYNRMAHAYVTTGQLSIMHLCCSLCAFIAWSVFLHGNYFGFDRILALFVLIIGAMLIVSRKQTEVN